jgi:hypothetical protein
MRRRPTIPLAEWRIATHVGATRAIQRLAGMPATGCRCDDCARWAAVAADVLPASLQEQLHRLGIESEYPTDLYASEEKEDGAYYRVVYHAIGKVLSGPRAVHQDVGDVALSWDYVELRPSPSWVGIVVLYEGELYGPVQWFKGSEDGKLIRIDVRLWVPRSKMC